MAVPEKIIELVENFDRDIDKYKHSYKEEDIKINYINPFFEALGWDVRNKSNNPPDQREVRFEDTLRSEGETQRPDYSFWLDRERKFFLDAKKPSVNIEGGMAPAFQIKRYAWSANLPLAIVTDFEEFAVYDCRTEPFKLDKPKKSRLLLIKYYEYEKRWDEIASLFSKEAVQKGSLGSIPPPRGKKVDDALLEDISDWRNALAASITKMNSVISQKSLNYAVQMTIDRILFLRICEDRSIEDRERLKKLLDEDAVYQSLFELFEVADKKYNSGLFHFHPEEERNNFDTITPSIKIEDKVLKNIIQGLYYPDSPYVFSEIPADILGHVYEQFLGKVIQLDESHKVSVVDKPEVRKAGGVYYTPSYIVDYIVKNTVGKLLEGKTPKDASDLHILDPACGSGSFLIVAYQHLLDWHLDWYKAHLVPLLKDDQKKRKPSDKEVQDLLPSPIEKLGKNARSRSKRIWERASEATLPIEERAEEWHLKTAERKRILLNNIYGVDIDTQAVEVTKLSLLLKVLEGENKATITDLNMYSDERALPDLGDNIKCGNSLIGWDILEGSSDITKEEIDRINPFDWEREFSDIMSLGGFDIAIGNPPYVRTSNIFNDKEYYKCKFNSAYGGYDIYVLFMERSLYLVRDNGIVGLITPNKFFVADYGAKIRYILIHKAKIIEIADLGKCKSVFADALISTAVTLYSKSRTSDKIRLKILNDDNVKQISDVPPREVPQKEIIDSEELIQVYQDSASNAILNKIVKQSQPLASVAQVRSGVMGFDYWAMDKCISDNNIGRRIATNSYIDRYKFLWGKKVNLYKKTFFNPRLSPDCDVLNTNTLELFASEKIVVRGVARRLTAMLDEEGVGILVAVHSVRGDRYSNKFLLALLNSTLFNYIHIIKFYSARIPQGSLRYPISFLSILPIRLIDFDNMRDVDLYNNIIDLVDIILALNVNISETKTGHEKTLLRRQIEATDRQIDRLVYELYGLNEEEIKIVEDGTS